MVFDLLLDALAVVLEGISALIHRRRRGGRPPRERTSARQPDASCTLPGNRTSSMGAHLPSPRRTTPPADPGGRQRRRKDHD